MAHLARVLELDPGNERARARLKELRRVAGNLPPYHRPLLASGASAGIPVPRPLIRAPESGLAPSHSLAWMALAALSVVFLLVLLLWSDAPNVVVAALMPTDTPTPEVVDDTACIACHTDEATLQALAQEEEAPEVESEGEG
jgi:mono/diheme cytochrome c family protein